MRRTTAEAAQTREAIIAAATAHFTEQGYAATSIATIAQDAGVTNGAIFHHFADKRDVFREVVKQQIAVYDARVSAAAAATGDDVETMFVGGCTAALDQALNSDYFRITIAEAPSVLGIDEWQHMDATVGLSSMRVALQMLDHEGKLAHEYSEALVRLLFGALTSAAVGLTRDDSDAPDKDELLAEFFTLVLGRATKVKPFTK